MSLHPTHSEACLNYSIKKYFVDRLHTVDGMYIDFSTIYMDVRDALDNAYQTWIQFNMAGNKIDGIMKDIRIGAYIFSRGDGALSPEDLLARTRDTLYEYLIDPTQTDGLARIPLYDISDYSIAGSFLVYPARDSENERAKDNTLYRLLPIDLKLAVM